ncbi:YcnI family protein [Leifsonia sp. fls2-241-R2A-40a]|uniref:YcnI family copper-binding membrane protein n=1 Tax=Leifsonia sp. fls2-241-R2A-40a TaxID=3040290 RepID=UPI00255025A0|nr:YcnI family protein [Leifsonia sp. fls2-241-R2A-40a]
MKKTTFAASVAAASTALLLAAAPLAASAHVHVDPDSAAPGSYTNLTFKVPTESATAGTVKLVVDLPTETPFTSVSYLPLAGWTTTVDTEKLSRPVKTDDGTITEAPVRVTWTADSGVQVEPGQFQQFTVSAGAVPDTGSVTLPTHQYYSDGTVVDWDQPTPASGKEPEHPAPTLYITSPAPAEDGVTPLVATDAPAVPGPNAAGAGTTATVVSIALGVGGLALGAIALVVAVFALTRVGRSAERKVQG